MQQITTKIEFLRIIVNPLKKCNRFRSKQKIKNKKKTINNKKSLKKRKIMKKAKIMKLKKAKTKKIIDHLESTLYNLVNII
jgi:hypothetical protein